MNETTLSLDLHQSNDRFHTALFGVLALGFALSLSQADFSRIPSQLIKCFRNLALMVQEGVHIFAKRNTNLFLPSPASGASSKFSRRFARLGLDYAPFLVLKFPCTRFIPSVAIANTVSIFAGFLLISILNGLEKDQKVLSPEERRTFEKLTGLTSTSKNNTSDVNNSEKIVKAYREELGKTVEVSSEIIQLSKEKIDSLKEFTFEDVEGHKKWDDLWVVVDGYVLDVSSFYLRHPGGGRVLLAMAGRDATDVFENFHPAVVYKSLSKFVVGKVKDFPRELRYVSQSKAGTNGGIMSDFRKIRQALLSLNLFETDEMYYFRKGVFLFFVFLYTIYLGVFVEGYLAHTTSALLLALFFQQFAFIGHDAGHNAVSHERIKDLAFSATIGNLLGGISISWWKHSHNIHHVITNSIEADPDIQHMPIMAVSEEMLGNFHSSYHQKIFVFDHIAKFFLSYQHYLYYPVMAVARFNLYIQSWLFFAKNKQWEWSLVKKGRVQKGKKFINYDAQFGWVEFGCSVLFITWVVLLGLCMDSWVESVAYVLLSHAAAGILHVQITLSHFSMDTYHGTYDKVLEKDDEFTENWVKLQLNTSLNVDNPPSVDWFHGGLQYQIEHHLFPRLPRHNLRLTREFVQALARKHGVKHRDLSFFEANKDMIGRLEACAMEARKRPASKAVSDFLESQLYEGMNLIG